MWRISLLNLTTEVQLCLETENNELKELKFK